MAGALSHPYALQRRHRFFFIRHAVEVLRQHHVFQRRKIGNQMKLLEDEADLLRAKAIQLRRRHA
jgi:hypothetical protein